MIKKIAHIADIHIRKSPIRHIEYREVFERLYKSLKNEKPDIIVLVGDIYHDFIDLQPEANILICEFFDKLSEIAPLRIIRGNHDIRKKAIRRTDSIEAIVINGKNPKVRYLNETGFFDDENITWAVWKHGEKNNSPWTKRKLSPTVGNTVIDLFHDPVKNSMSPKGYSFMNKSLNDGAHFKGDFSFFGDIHKYQIIENGKAYSGSLIAQDFAEGDDEFHGYLIWDIDDPNKEPKPISIENNYSYNTVYVNIFTNFNELDLTLENPTKYNRVRVIWKTKPNTRNNENERNVDTYLKNKYNIVSLQHKNEFDEEDTIELNDEITIEQITDQSVQHEVFKKYLEKIGVEEDQIDKIIELDDEIASRINIEEFTNIKWDIMKLSGTNFMSYENLDITDWDNNDGLYQITGLNAAGKTTIIKLITYILFNKTLETESRAKYGDSRYVNNRNDAKYCEGSICINVNGELYGIKRRTDLEYNKDGELKGAPTKVEYYKLNSIDDELSYDNSISSLTDEDRLTTQKLIDRAIGTYENFKRIIITTSDTLNRILDNDKAVFVDSILYDSGLDIFDEKLNAFKEYEADYLKLPRYKCDVELSEERVNQLQIEGEGLSDKIEEYEQKILPDISSRIIKGEDFIDGLKSKLFSIDESIYTMDVRQLSDNIVINETKIGELEKKSKRLSESISQLAETYDEEAYDKLLIEKENHIVGEREKFSKIKEYNIKHDNCDRTIEQINGKVFLLKKSGKEYKEGIIKLKESKVCPTCGQMMSDEHRIHIDTNINELEEKMFAIAKDIKNEEDKITEIKTEQTDYITKIKLLEDEITSDNNKMDTVLSQLGVITNIINDVNHRKDLTIQLEKIDPEIKILRLENNNYRNDIRLYNQNQEHINANESLNNGIHKAKERVADLRQQESINKDKLYTHKTYYGQCVVKIVEINVLIAAFKEQEKIDNIHAIYKKCIHRDGIPTQLLKNYAIPKINRELSDLLKNVNFSIWLDENDLKLKLAYDKISSTIEAISGSGKERTFACLGLKFALYLINAKSKPTIFLLDEVMGKLTDTSVDEFIEILQIIKDRVRKLLIVEHNHDINPDYLIEVELDDNKISNVTIG